MSKHFFGDTALLTGRSLRHIMRSPDTIITTTIMPIAFMLLFVYVFGGAISSGSGSYVKYLLPGILLLFTLALTWLAVIAGLSAKTVDGASAFSYPLIFLPFISSAFVATATMPGPVRAFAENQPVTPIVNTIRDLYAQQPISTGIWIALAWCAGILIVAYALAMATYHRKIA